MHHTRHLQQQQQQQQQHSASTYGNATKMIPFMLLAPLVCRCCLEKFRPANYFIVFLVNVNDSVQHYYGVSVILDEAL